MRLNPVARRQIDCMAHPQLNHHQDKNCQRANGFWDIVKNDFTDQQLRQFLQFATGQPAPPHEGFAFMIGSSSNRRTLFKIHILRFDIVNTLSVSHTCFIQIDISRYSSKEQLKAQLLLAIESTNVVSGVLLGDLVEVDPYDNIDVESGQFCDKFGLKGSLI
ncbi:MAG: hypothetical protein EZS28_032552 [Streblomastix strix]|uniref:HECT-type E3 ubiquitin transferase n=1 Tax=Streblomastix strix TaxID=222440 RepID=A0A5J4UPA8_9EUKA|nr:MAG: hypothetical protein EZS28_032552 [Streblomastix strix]